MALMLADEKADLALVDINWETVRETQSECQARGTRAEAYHCDMAAKADIESMLAQVSAAFGRVDILINNAGTVVGKYVHQYEYDDLTQTMLVNYIGGAYLTRLVLPDMMSRNEGHIVNMASVIGLVAMPHMGEYVASKFAIVGFTETLRMELKKAGYPGIKTLCVCPTGVDTGLFPGYKAPQSALVEHRGGSGAGRPGRRHRRPAERLLHPGGGHLAQRASRDRAGDPQDR